MQNLPLEKGGGGISTYKELQTSGEITIRQSDCRWRIRGLEKNMSVSQLRVNVLVSLGESFDLELPRGERRLPKHVLTKEEAEKIMNQTNVKDPLGIRDRAILETFYSTTMCAPHWWYLLTMVCFF